MGWTLLLKCHTINTAREMQEGGRWKQGKPAFLDECSPKGRYGRGKGPI